MHAAPSAPTEPMPEESHNANHLVPSRGADDAARKLRALTQPSAQPDARDRTGTSHRIRRKSPRIWPFVAALAALLLGTEFAFHSRRERAETAGAGLPSAGARLEPPPGLAPDELARFWCYALYDRRKLVNRFNVPRNAAPDPREARARLERLLAGPLGDDVRGEIRALREAGNRSPASAPVPR